MQVVERRQQLAVREIAGAAEDDDVTGRRSGASAGAFAATQSPCPPLTAWPPNWLRSAASSRSANGFVLARPEAGEERAPSGPASARRARSPRAASSALRRSPRRSLSELDRSASSASARAASSSSHDRTTLPCIHSAATAAEVEPGTRSRASARSLRHRPASARTRSRCGSSSRSGRRRDRRRAGIRRPARASGRPARVAGRRRRSPPTIRQ